MAEAVGCDARAEATHDGLFVHPPGGEMPVVLETRGNEGEAENWWSQLFRFSSRVTHPQASVAGDGQSKGKRPSVSQGCQIDCSTLKSTSWPSVKAKYRKIAVRRGVKVPSPDVFAHGPVLS